MEELKQCVCCGLTNRESTLKGTRGIKHTPGPWEVTGSNIRSDNHIDGTGALLLLPGPMFHAYEPDPEEQTANLKLAAAAPAMLMALQAWIWLAERSSMDGIDHEVGMTKAAITKAIESGFGAEKEDKA
jgi:hypothetical protein